MLRKIPKVSLVLALLLSAEALYANITIPNPGFEAPVLGGGQFQYTPAGGSWSFVGGAGISGNGSGFTGGNSNAPEGAQVAFIQGNSQFSQQLSGFSAGVNYTLRFYAAQRSYGQAGQTWNVKIDGNVIGSFNPPQSATGYIEYTATFTTSAGSHQLVFEGSNLNSGDNTIFIDNVRITSPSLDAGAWISSDIGNVGTIGSATYNNGTFTINGGGDDIWNAADAFQYVYQPWTGDVELIARVTSLQQTDPWAKAGVMIRESLAPDSKFAMMVLTPGYGTSFQRRNSTGGFCQHITPGNNSGTPCWVRITRVGSTLTGYKSSDGANWVQVGTDTVSMNNAVYVGLPVTAHNNNAICTATFDNVTVQAIGATSISVPNFGFETPALGNGQFAYNPAGGSWTFDSGTGIAANGSGFTASNPNAPQGSQVGILQGTSGFSQPLSGFSPGATYTITFAAAQRSFSQAGQTWDVKVNGTTVGSFAPSQSSTAYTDYSCQFVASSSTHTLEFRGSNLNGGDNTVFLDNVRINSGSNSSLPAPPSGLSANTISSSQINLSWNDNANNETGFKIERKTGLGGSYSQIDSVGANVTAYSNTGLQASTTYYYRVRAYNSAGDSTYSTEENATTQSSGGTGGAMRELYWRVLSPDVNNLNSADTLAKVDDWANNGGNAISIGVWQEAYMANPSMLDQIVAKAISCGLKIYFHINVGTVYNKALAEISPEYYQNALAFVWLTDGTVQKCLGNPSLNTQGIFLAPQLQLFDQNANDSSTYAYKVKNLFIYNFMDRFQTQYEQGHVQGIGFGASGTMEIHYEIDGHFQWMGDGSLNHLLDYRSWLAARYNNHIGALNSAWGSGYSSFNDVQFPAFTAGEPWNSFAGNSGRDFYRFRHWRLKSAQATMGSWAKARWPNARLKYDYGQILGPAGMPYGTKGFVDMSGPADVVKENLAYGNNWGGGAAKLYGSFNGTKLVQAELDGSDMPNGTWPWGLTTGDIMFKMREFFLNGGQGLSFFNDHPRTDNRWQLHLQVLNNLYNEGYRSSLPSIIPNATVPISNFWAATDEQVVNIYNNNSSHPISIPLDDNDVK